MKLTNEKRDKIIQTIKEELFSSAEKKEIKIKIGAELRKLIDPEIDLGWEKYKKYIETNEKIYLRYAPEGTSDYYPCNQYPDSGVKDTLNFEDLPEDIASMVREYSDRLIEVNKKIAEIKNVLLACNTDKQLLDLVPEFEKYIPKGNHIFLPVPIETIKNVKNILSGEPK